MTSQSQHTSLSQSFEALRPRLRLWALKLLGNDEDADDALQDAFFRLWRHRNQAPAKELTPEVMSHTALRSACIDLLRKRRVRISEPIERMEIADTSEANEMVEMAEEVKNLIDSQLDPKAREVLMLHDSLGYDYGEIASRLEITEANARVILSRARKAVREAYRHRSCRQL